MSSDDVAILVSNLSKRYEIYETPGDRLRQFLLPKLLRTVRLNPKTYFSEFWALKQVSFVVKRGHAYGIVGLNGSGKSTLLQIIAGTLTPTSGEVQIKGRVAALLELGSGFNTDFSGEENVMMYGTLLGFSTADIKVKLPAIRAFAEIGEHFFQPLSTYSSGMQMRLAFSVATAFDPDILIVDEALAVGDAYFQQKCFLLLDQFRGRGGTLLFVSHDANSVKTLCNGAILLENGTKIADGEPKIVIDIYQAIVMQKSDIGTTKFEISQGQNQYETGVKVGHIRASIKTGNGDADLMDFKLLDSELREVVSIESESRLTVKYVVRLNKVFDRPAFGVIVRDCLGQSIYETTTFAQLGELGSMPEGALVTVQYSFLFNVRMGQYSFSAGISNKGYARSEFEEYSLLMHDVAQIQVTECATAKYYGGRFNMHPEVFIETSQ